MVRYVIVVSLRDFEFEHAVLFPGIVSLESAEDPSSIRVVAVFKISEKSIDRVS